MVGGAEREGATHYPPPTPTGWMQGLQAARLIPRPTQGGQRLSRRGNLLGFHLFVGFVNKTCRGPLTIRVECDKEKRLSHFNYGAVASIQSVGFPPSFLPFTNTSCIF